MRRTVSKIHRVVDARDRAEKILPPVVFGYLDGGSSDEITLRENRHAWEEVTLRPRAAAVPPTVDLSTEVLGEHLAFPLVLAPIGGLRLLHPDADRAAVRAANAAGVGAILSTNSGTPMEEVLAAATGTAWFQLYFRGGREGAEGLVERAQRAGFKALFVTLDVSGGIGVERIAGYGNQLARLRGDQAQDVALPSTLSLRNAFVFAPQLLRHLTWTAGYVHDGVPRRFAQQDDATVAKAVAAIAGTDDRPFIKQDEPPKGTPATIRIPTWEDLESNAAAWKGNLIAKGLVRGDDARRAIDLGADGILVSNHGGRQVDTGITTLRALPEVRAAVGPDVPLFIDGGVRRGADIVKALALGANAAVMGRPYAYGLAAAGQPGVARILEVFRLEMLQAIRALGLASVAEIDPESFDFTRFNRDQRVPVTGT